MAAYETAVRASSSSPHQTGPGSQDRTDGLSIIGRVLNQLSFSRMEPRARIELASPLYRSGASPAMLAGPKIWSQRSESNARRTSRPWRALPCACSPIELHRLEPKGGFEPPSELYEGSVFPTKLLRPFSSKYLERVTGFEPVSGPWQGPILAARRYPPGASGENRTLLASLEGWNSANKSHSLEIHVLTFNCQRTHFGGSAWTVRSLQP